MTAEEARAISKGKMKRYYKQLDENIANAANAGRYSCKYEFCPDPTIADMLCAYLKANGFRYTLRILDGFSSKYYALNIEWGKENE